MLSTTGIVLLNFFIGFISDLILNYLSRQKYAPASIKVLEVYFKRKEIKTEPLRTIITAVNAGLTIAICLVIIMLISYLIFGFAFPVRLNQLFKYIILAFVVGYAADVIIYKLHIFGDTLDPYYKLVGAGLWGALAFIFSIVLSYFLNFYL
jgi:hypothetical protein